MPGVQVGVGTSAAQVHEAGQKRLIDYQVKAQKELLAAQYDASTAYTNVVIGAGYVAFFAMWAFTRDLLTARSVLWSATFMIVSLLSFVGFEVFKVLRVSLALRKMDRITFGAADHFQKDMERFTDQEQVRAIFNGRVWLAAFIVSAFFGFSAAGILLWAFIESLIWDYR